MLRSRAAYKSVPYTEDGRAVELAAVRVCAATARGGDSLALPPAAGPREVGSRCRNDMSGYLSGHAILSSGVRGRKGSYRKGGRDRERARVGE